MLPRCSYRRCGPKRRRSTREESEDDSDAPATGGSEDGRFLSTHKILTSRERQFIAKFYNCVNKFIPMTSHTVLRDAMNPLPLNVIDGFVPSEVSLSLPFPIQAEREILSGTRVYLAGEVCSCPREDRIEIGLDSVGLSSILSQWFTRRVCFVRMTEHTGCF